MAKPGTIPVTTILSRDLRKWLESEARKEDKKLGPYIRKVLEHHRTAVDAANSNYTVKES